MDDRINGGQLINANVLATEEAHPSLKRLLFFQNKKCSIRTSSAAINLAQKGMNEKKNSAREKAIFSRNNSLIS